MSLQTYSVITASGSYIPTQRITNEHFLQHTFFDAEGNKLDKPNEEIIRKFSEITGITERRYVTDDLNASDIGFFAAQDALDSGHIDGESLDYIIVAHNFGDVRADNRKSDMVPALASRVKMRLGIKNPDTVCYDLPFGCAGWLQGVIQADCYIKSGEAKRVMIIGAETLSRICDPCDRDSMIYADGAAAVVLEARESRTPVGFLSHKAHTNAGDYTYVLNMGKSNNPDFTHNGMFLKMRGRVLYEHALKEVPPVVREAVMKSGVKLEDIDKVLIHQANHKMDEAILKRVFNGSGTPEMLKKIMPMTISWLGNSSVATVPTLYDLIAKGKFEGMNFRKGSVIVFAAVGAGVNINAAVYRVPE